MDGVTAKIADDSTIDVKLANNDVTILNPEFIPVFAELALLVDEMNDSQ